MQETWVQSLAQEDALKKGMATHSSILAWRIPWTEEPGGLESMGHKELDTTKWLTFFIKQSRVYSSTLYNHLSSATFYHRYIRFLLQWLLFQINRILELKETSPINPLVSKMRSYSSSEIYRLIHSLTAGLNQSRTRTLLSQLQANLLPLWALHVCLFLCNRMKAPNLWITSDYFAAFFLCKVCYHSQKTLTFTRLWICDCAISK